MPTYNGEKYITAALESVRQQHDSGIELIVVDDGSSDRTLDIIRSFSRDLNIKLITPGRTGNWVAGTNIGLREAGGDWACLLHQDDFWLPGRIARLRKEIEHAQGALILHNAVFVGLDGERIGPWTCPLAEGNVPSGTFLERLLIQNFIAIPATIFRRYAAVDSGGLDESLWFSADWDLWLRLGSLGPVRFIDETLAAFRVHPTSQTIARKTQPQEWDQQLRTVLTRHLSKWSVTGRRRRAIERAAMVSIVVNSALSAASRGDRFRVWNPLLKLVALGPSGWHRYLRDSRILQRVRPRLRIQRLAKRA